MRTKDQTRQVGEKEHDVLSVDVLSINPENGLEAVIAVKVDSTQRGLRGAESKCTLFIFLFVKHFESHIFFLAP